MVKMLLTVACLLITAGPAAAQGAAERLRQILSAVPQSTIETNAGTIVAGYGNGDAIRWIAVRGAQAGRNPETPHLFAAQRSAPPNQSEIFQNLPLDQIRSAVGLVPSDWVETWEVSQGPVRLGAMDIFPDSEMRLRGALYSAGFEETERFGSRVMWVGEDDYAFDTGRVDPGDPFGGAEGLPLRMVFDGDRALWATGWGGLEQVMSRAGPSLVERPDAQTLLSGLSRARNLGGLVSVRAWLENGGTVPINGAQDGLVTALALADFANRESEGAALVLAFPDGADVEAIASSLRDAWPVLSVEPGPAVPEITEGNGSVTVTLRSDWGLDGAASNQCYDHLSEVLNSGRLGHLLHRLASTNG